MALAELVALGVAIVVTISAYSVAYVRRFVTISSPYVGGPTRKPKPPQKIAARMDQGELYFQFDKIFMLKMESKSSARLFQIGLLAILFAVAFLIITYGLRNLGF